VRAADAWRWALLPVNPMIRVIGIVLILATPIVAKSQECIQVTKLKVPAVHGRVVTVSERGYAEVSIPNAEIELRQGPYGERKTIAKVTADSTGAFDIPSVRPGRYDIYARSRSLEAWANIIVVKSSAHDAEKTLLVMMVAPVPSETCGTARLEKLKLR
jgi:hypothetical protein